MTRTTLVNGISAGGLLIVIAGWLVVWYAIGDRNPVVGFKIILVGLTLAMVPLSIDLMWCLWVGGMKK